MKQKYTFVLFCSYDPDYFMQVPYQSDTEIRNIFRFENVDFSLQSGLQAVIPFSVKTLWQGNLSLTGVRVQHKASHFHSLSFNRKAYIARVSLKNTFNLSAEPNLKLTVDGFYMTPGMIQGPYDMSRIWNVSAGLKWTSRNDRASLVLKANDIFRSGTPELTVNEGTQWNRMHLLNDDRCLSLSFIWKFNGYKAKQHERIDTSRFGK